MSEIPITWRFHPDGELIIGLKTKAYRSGAYLVFLRKQRCWSCPARNDITASHIFRGYHGLKNHDWVSIPQCGPCHWEYEYHKDVFEQRWGRVPNKDDAEKYFQRFLKESGREDDRTEGQLVSI